MSTPLSRKTNRHAFNRPVELPKRPAPDSARVQAEKERALVDYIAKHGITKLPMRKGEGEG